MVSASENGGRLTDVARVRLSTVPPEFRFRAASLIGIVLCGLTLGMLMTFLPLFRQEPSTPQWPWLIGSVAFVAYVLCIQGISLRPVRAALRERLPHSCEAAVLLTGVTVSHCSESAGAANRPPDKPSRGWLWLGDGTLTVATIDGTLRIVQPSDVVRVARLDVLGGFFFEPQLALWLQDGTVIEAQPTRFGVTSMFPYGRARTNALVHRLEDFAGIGGPHARADG